MPARPGRLRLTSDSCTSARGFASRFFQRSPHRRRLAVHLGRHDQLPGGLSPPSHRPCWAHMQQGPAGDSGGALLCECARRDSNARPLASEGRKLTDTPLFINTLQCSPHSKTVQNSYRNTLKAWKWYGFDLYSPTVLHHKSGKSTAPIQFGTNNTMY